MSPSLFKKRSSAWGVSSSGRGDSGISLSAGMMPIIIVFLFIFVAGIFVGYIVKGFGSQNDKKDTPVIQDLGLAQEAFANSLIIDPSLAGMETSPNSADGAVRAATSFISGYSALSVAAEDARNSKIDSIVSSTADPAVGQSIKLSISRVAQLLGNPTTVQDAGVAIFTSPVTYKVEDAGDGKFRVQIWAVVTVADANNSDVSSFWSTHDITLRWEDQWKIVLYSLSDGPVPTPLTQNADQLASSYEETLQRINGFQAYRSSLGRPGKK